MAHADVAVVLPKASTVPTEWEGVNEELVWYHTPSPCVSKEGCVQDWWSVGNRLAARARGDDVGETRVRGDPSLYEGMWMQIRVVKHRQG